MSVIASPKASENSAPQPGRDLIKLLSLGFISIYFIDLDQFKLKVKITRFDALNVFKYY